jgi:DNA/RNA-binding domain of Phe-tRNA-synthetase-like protein
MSEEVFVIYRVEPKVFELVPDFCRGVVVAHDVANTAPANDALERLLRERIEAIERDTEIGHDHPKIKRWGEVYKTFPITKDKGRIEPSVAALVRRIKSGKGAAIPFISPLVCISNLTSLTYLVPSGLIDAGKVEGDLVLGAASGEERFEPISGDGVQSPQPGEIIYYDTGTGAVLCRAWNSRGGKAGMIFPTTRKAIIDVDCLLTAMSYDDIESATNGVARLVEQHCGARTTVHFLSKSNPSLEVDL